jgi:hypothetical protein
MGNLGNKEQNRLKTLEWLASRVTDNFSPFFVFVSPHWYELLRDYKLVQSDEEWQQIVKSRDSAPPNEYNVLRSGILFSVLQPRSDAYLPALIYWDSRRRFVSEVEFEEQIEEIHVENPTLRDDHLGAGGRRIELGAPMLTQTLGRAQHCSDRPPPLAGRRFSSIQAHVRAERQSWQHLGQLSVFNQRRPAHNHCLRKFLPPRAKHKQLNRNLLEAVGANWAGQPNYSRERQLLPTDPPDKAESLRALGAGCDGEGHALRFYCCSRAGLSAFVARCDQPDAARRPPQ